MRRASVRRVRSPVLLPGDLLEGKYRIIEHLGEGAMGVVLLAHDEKLDRRVAIKLVHGDLPDSQHERLLSEARTMARITHRNVIPIYSFGNHKGVPYFVMRYMAGTDLSTWLESRGLLSFDEALGIMTEICRGVQAMHKAGTAHLDLKPANVLIDSGFHIAVGDLGLASRLTDAGIIRGQLGTPHYMAPQIILGQDLRPDEARRADIYALGVMAFELFTGEMPFDGQDLRYLLVQQLQDEPPRPSDIRPDLPRQLDDAILAALSKSPESRPASAADLAASLRDARAQAPSLARVTLGRRRSGRY